jgi:hypothetical protein
VPTIVKINADDDSIIQTSGMQEAVASFPHLTLVNNDEIIPDTAGHGEGSI